jgi:hypothetical protein
VASRPYDHPRVDLADVEQAMREVGDAHCCDVTLALRHPVRPGTPVLFWVSMTATPRIVGRRTIRQPHTVSHRFPHVDCRTVEGLMFRLAHKLDHDLDELGHCPAEQAQFAWDKTE